VPGAHVGGELPLKFERAHAFALRPQLVLENSGDAYDKSVDKKLDAEAVDVEEVSPHKLRALGAPAQGKSYDPQKIEVRQSKCGAYGQMPENALDRKVRNKRKMWRESSQNAGEDGPPTPKHHTIDERSGMQNRAATLQRRQQSKRGREWNDDKVAVEGSRRLRCGRPLRLAVG
jgi:hypothetical protein